MGDIIVNVTPTVDVMVRIKVANTVWIASLSQVTMPNNKPHIIGLIKSTDPPGLKLVAHARKLVLKKNDTIIPAEIDQIKVFNFQINESSFIDYHISKVSYSIISLSGFRELGNPVP